MESCPRNGQQLEQAYVVLMDSQRSILNCLLSSCLLYGYFHVAAVSVKMNVILIKKSVVFPAKIVCYKILIHMQTFSLSSFMNHE